MKKLLSIFMLLLLSTSIFADECTSTSDIDRDEGQETSSDLSSETTTSGDGEEN